MKNTKKLLSIFLMLSIIAVIAQFSVSADFKIDQETGGNDSELLDVESYIESNIADSWSDLSCLTELEDTPSYTRNDLKNNFQNYASEDATILAPNKFRANSASANVVGVVLDFFTDQPVSGAEIYIDKELLVVTDQSGRFQIVNMADGQYNFEIIAQDYQTSKYYNYSVDALEDTIIFTFYVRDDKPFVRDKNDYTHGAGNSAADLNSSLLASPYASTTIPHVDNNVYVEMDGERKTVKRQSYLQGVLGAEMDSIGTLDSHGMSEAEILQLYTAQAITASSFLEYCKNVYSNHQDTDCDVCDTDNCQGYDPTKTNSIELTAVSNIFNTVGGKKTCVALFYKPSTTYNYFYAAYFSDCDNRGSKNYSGQPALRAVACTDLYDGYDGSRYGLCQTGAAYLATQGYNAVNICKYYYTDVVSAFCIIDNI